MHIRIESLSKRYGRGHALDRVSLEIAPGQIVAVLGLNGAGKSTLLRCLAGLTAPTRGEFFYDDKSLSREDLALRRRFYFLADSPFLLGDVDVLRNISTILRLYEADGPGAEERVLALLEEFDLIPFVACTPHELSRGQAFKVGLVALLAVDPEVWLCDEPLGSGMDPLGLAAFRRHARAAAARGRTIIYSTQILELAEKFSDRAVILHEGRLMGYDALDRLAGSETDAPAALTALFQRMRDEP